MSAGGYVPIEDADGDSLEERLAGKFVELMGHESAEWKPLLDETAPASNGEPGP